MHIKQTPTGYIRFNIDRDLSGTGIDKNNLAASGITEIPDPARPDDRYYYVSEINEAATQDGPWVSIIPKALEDVTNDDGTVTKGLKTAHIAQIKQQANGLLSQSDWKVVRAAEGIKPVDQTTLDYRAAVRAASNANEALIGLTTTVDELAALYQSSGTPEAPVPAQIQWPETL